MKRGNLLKLITGIAMSLFVANGLFAQVEVSDYTAISGAATEIDSVTVGSTTRLYVKPDAYFHPNYTAVGTWALTPNFTWTWNVPGGAGTVDAGETTNDVWVQVDWSGTAGGPYNVTVTETAPAAFGGCSGDTNVYVSVIASPTVTFTADNPGTIIGTNLTVCEGDARLSDNVQATLTGIRSWQLDWHLQITTRDVTDAVVAYFDDDNATKLGAAGNALEYPRATGLQQTVGAAAGTYNLAKPTGGFISIEDPDDNVKRQTVYIYSLNAVNDRISRKSDYLGNPTELATGWTWYDTTAETITIRVNPAPVTGPIYHIPNNWAE
ncbi:MAG: hypothetical protein JXB00_00880 [Bacteroidales bacterium]|nr:hypothetical protein [Bacteroidales bacterium]